MRRVSFFIIAFIFWVLITWSLSWQHLLIGAIVCFLVTLFFGDKFVTLRIFSPKRMFWFIIYFPLFVWYCIRANLDVAFRAIHPKMPLRPGIVKIKTSLKKDISKTFLANSITLTPGTMTVDIDGEYLYIHWIWVQDERVEEATKIVAGRFEKFIRRIFE